MRSFSVDFMVHLAMVGGYERGVRRRRWMSCERVTTKRKKLVKLAAANNTAVEWRDWCVQRTQDGCSVFRIKNGQWTLPALWPVVRRRLSGTPNLHRWTDH